MNQTLFIANKEFTKKHYNKNNELIQKIDLIEYKIIGILLISLNILFFEF